MKEGSQEWEWVQAGFWGVMLCEEGEEWGRRGGVGVESGALLFVDPCDGWLVCVCVCEGERERERDWLFFLSALSLFPLSSCEQSRAGLNETRTKAQTCADQSAATPQRQERRRVCWGENKRKKAAFFFFLISKLWWISNVHQKKSRRTERIFFPSQLKENNSFSNSNFFF